MSALAIAEVLSLLVRAECGAGLVPIDRMLAKTTVESGRDPLEIHVNGPGGGDLHPATLADAISKAKALLAAGRSIDLGIAQINDKNLASHGLTVETAFDACRSLRAGSEHLAADMVAWRHAESRYNTGDFQRGIDNGYAAKVERVMSHLPLAATEAQTAPAPPAPPPHRARATTVVTAWQSSPEIVFVTTNQRAK